jgi:hypothetical protein
MGQVGEVCSVAYKATIVHKFSPVVYRWQPALYRKLCKLCSLINEDEALQFNFSSNKDLDGHNRSSVINERDFKISSRSAGL